MRLFHIRRRPAEATVNERPLCIVYGNCQAEQIRRMLEHSPSFAAAFRTEPVEGVHRMSADSIDAARQVVSRAAVIISQPVRDGYKGRPVGSRETFARAPRSCRQLTIPALYYDALYPFQVYVRTADGATCPAPIVEAYHDLRFLYCAARGWDVHSAGRWLRSWEPPADAVRALAHRAQQNLAAHEADLDVRVLDRLLEPDVRGESFFTVNHPTNRALSLLVAAIHEQLGLAYTGPPADDDELLGRYRTPLERSVIAALGLAADERPDWVVDGERYPLERMLEAHLEFYREHPEVLRAGLAEHRARMSTAGLGL